MPSWTNMRTEKLPIEGGICREIGQYQREDNVLFKIAGSLDCRRTRPSGYDGSLSKTMHLCATFDEIHAIPGLWNGMRLGSLNRIMALKCESWFYPLAVCDSANLIPLGDYTLRDAC